MMTKKTTKSTKKKNITEVQETEKKTKKKLVSKTPKAAAEKKKKEKTAPSRPRAKKKTVAVKEKAPPKRKKTKAFAAEVLVIPPEKKAGEKAKKPQPAVEVLPPPAKEVLPEPKKEAPAAEPKKEAVLPVVKINEMVTVKILAEKINVRVNDLIKKMLSMGTLVTINQRLDQDTSTLIAHECGYNIEWVPLYGGLETGIDETDDEASLVLRPPIVTVMGHVDHGKTSLLDGIRKTNVVSKEAGGITQHIGAYRVRTSRGEVVFLDTPGHEAFTAMRARGAQTTDIVILVVAANDGVKPQTVEAIDHARAANVPIMVAINKIDLPSADPQKVKQQLSQYNLIPEEWGGNTIMVEVSATKFMNIDKLLEMILLQAEIMELKANPSRPAVGVVVEARLDQKRGSAATVLIQKGTLHVGDSFVAGLWSGRVRALIDDTRRHIKEAGPSIPVEVLGLSGAPHAGDRFVVVQSDREARIIAERRQVISREESLTKKRHLTLEDLNKMMTEGKINDLKIILKADVQGSVEVLRDSLEKLSTSSIKLTVLHYGVGGIVESDVILAAASDAIIIGFNIRPELQAEKTAQREGVDIRTYRVIYEVMADIRAAMEGLLEPETKEVAIGRAEVREAFKVPKVGIIAGCMVVDGRIERNAFIRLLRDNVIVYEGKISSLRRFKDDVRQVEKGFECGIGIENYHDIKKSDMFEVFIKEKVKRKLET